MARKLLTEEQDAYLRSIAWGRDKHTLARMINEKFGTSFTPTQIYQYKSRYKIHSGRVSVPQPHLFTKEQEEFIQKHYKGIGNYELTNLINTEFGTSFTKQQVKGYKQRCHLDSGLTAHFNKGHVPVNKGKKLSPELYEKARPTMFSKGHIPHNIMPIGTEIADKNGYVMVKVNDIPGAKKKENWKFKQRLIWEEHYGAIPDGYVIIFKDGDKSNFDIDNLMCISKEENAVLNKRKLRSDDPKLTEASVNVVRLTNLISSKEGEIYGKETN